jgi:hypothetical protein
MRQITMEEQQALRSRYPKMDAHTEFIATTQEFVDLHNLQVGGAAKDRAEVIELLPHDINGKIMRVFYSEKLNKCWVNVGQE